MDQLKFRIGKVFFNAVPAGIIQETAEGFSFSYLNDYCVSGTPIAYTLPLKKQPFMRKTLFPFFENLVSEGWLRQTQSRAQHIDENDRFGLLLANGKDLTGAVTVEEIPDAHL